MFTQYGPHAEAGWPDGAREAYAQRCLDVLAGTRRTSATPSSTTRCSRRPTSSASSACVGGSIFQGEQGLDQMAFMRPSPRARALRDAGGRPVPVRGRDAPGRRRDRGAPATTRRMRVLRDRRARPLAERRVQAARAEGVQRERLDTGAGRMKDPCLNEPQVGRRSLAALAARRARAGSRGRRRARAAARTRRRRSPSSRRRRRQGHPGRPDRRRPGRRVRHPARPARLPGDAAAHRRAVKAAPSPSPAASCRSTTTPTTSTRRS